MKNLSLHSAYSLVILTDERVNRMKRKILHSDNSTLITQVKPKPPCASAITLPFTTPIASPFLSPRNATVSETRPIPVFLPYYQLETCPKVESGRSQLESDRYSLFSPFSRSLSLSALSSFPVLSLSLDLPREILRRNDWILGSVQLR